MNLPFGLPNVKENSVRRYYESAQITALYDHKLSEYSDLLERYKKCIIEYSDKLDGYDKRSMDNQLSIIQMALDMTYLKEQGDKTIEFLDDTKDNMEGLDKNVVNRLSELVLTIQKQSAEQNKQLQAEVLVKVDMLTRKVKREKALIWFFVFINLLSLGALAIFVLYYMDMIPFLG